MNVIEMIDKGGFFMYPILITSFIAMVFIAERAYYLFFELSLNMTEFSNRIFRAVEAGDVNGAIKECHYFFKHPLPQILNAALAKANRGDKEIERAIQAKYLQAAPKVQERVGYLSMLANVATLLGLLGTIIGLIQSFKAVALADAAAKQEALANGISVAMSTTAFGLIVAIPCLLAFNILSNRQNKILDHMQESATELLNLISASNKDLRMGPQKVIKGEKN